MSIVLESITKQFGSHTIFKDLNLTINDGEFTIITGKSGCGKSTLLNIMGLLEPLNAGKMYINSKLAPAINSKDATIIRRNTIGYLFQNYALLDNKTVLENLQYALHYCKNNRTAKQKLIERALADVSLTSTILNQKVFELSGGEQQRVAIARLILKPCNYILADEPTGSLDSDNTEAVIALLQRLNSDGKTIVLVTHNPAIVSKYSKVINL